MSCSFYEIIYCFCCIHLYSMLYRKNEQFLSFSFKMKSRFVVKINSFLSNISRSWWCKKFLCEIMHMAVWNCIRARTCSVLQENRQQMMAIWWWCCRWWCWCIIAWSTSYIYVCMVVLIQFVNKCFVISEL